ncbi:MAG: hypothetical protein QM710_02845 [Flavobacterium sp.]
MKTNSPNVLFNHRAILLLGKTSQVMKQKLLLLLTLVFFFSVGFAQTGRTSQSGSITVTEMNSVIFSNGGGSSSARMASTGTSSSTIDSDRLKSLVTQVQAATYFFEGNVRTFGSAPVSLFTDLGSLNQVNSAITLKNNIELVTIRINTASELNSTIDLAAFSNFPNLKYVYFITKLNTTSDGIASHILNYDSRFNILYKIDKGDSNQ